MMKIEQFIHTYIEDVDQLRALLLLHRDGATAWDVVDVGTQLHLPPALAGAVLARLETSGLIACHGEPPRYQYGPRSAELAELVDQVVQLDRERPVTLLNTVYARPTDIQAFADAFRLRKEKDR